LNRFWPWTLIWVIGSLLFRLAIAVLLPPGYDEAYYYLYTHHPDWSYFDHPLGVAIGSALGPALTGVATPLTLRLATLLMFCGSQVMLGLTARRLFGDRAGVMTVALAALTPVLFAVFGILDQPDGPLMLFWSGGMWLLAERCFGRSGPVRPGPWMVGFGVLLGLATLGKYYGLLLGGGVLGFCLTRPRFRGLVTSPWLLAALAATAFTSAPLWGWNIHHDWISFRFQGGRVNTPESYDLLRVLGLLGEHWGMLFPTISLPLAWVSVGNVLGLVRGRYRPDEADRRALLLWLGLPIAVGFTLLGGKMRVLPSWPMPGYWSLLPLLGVAAADWGQQHRRGLILWLGSTAALVGGLGTLAVLHIRDGVAQVPGTRTLLPALTLEPPGGCQPPPRPWWQLLPVQCDTSVELFLPERLTAAARANPQFMAALQRSDFLFTNDYMLAGQYALGLDPIRRLPITTFSQDPRGFAFWSRPEDWLGRSGLFLTTAKLQGDSLRELTPLFRSLTYLTELPLRRNGEVVMRIRVYRAEKMVQPYRWPYGLPPAP